MAESSSEQSNKVSWKRIENQRKTKMITYRERALVLVNSRTRNQSRNRAVNSEESDDLKVRWAKAEKKCKNQLIITQYIYKHAKKEKG